MLDLILEFIIDLVFELGAEVAGSQKVPKWIRYLLLAFFSLFSCAIVLLLIGCGIVYMNESPFLSTILIIAGVAIVTLGYLKIRKRYRARKEERNET